MKERRRRLVKNLYKKEGRLNEFEKSYEKSMRQKGQVIRTFDAAQLEDMLRTSTKNVAQEVVSALVYSRKGGVLSDLLSEQLKRKNVPPRGPPEAGSASKPQRTTPRGAQ